MRFDSVCTVKKEFDKDVFLRELLVKLGKDEDTPVDVVDAQFSEVRDGYRETFICTASVTGTCTASIGYDRTETYTDYEKYKEKVGDTYVERTRPVTKTRTVTDWRPFQEIYSGKYTCAEENADTELFSKYNVGDTLQSISKDSLVVTGDAEVNRSALIRALANCEYHVERSQVSLPGDKQKDIHYNSSSEVESISCYILPTYEVTYTYDGEEYLAYCFACGDLRIHYKAPKRKDAPQKKTGADIAQEATKEVAPMFESVKTAWRAFYIALAASAVVCFLLKFCWLWPAAVAALVYAYITNKKYKEKYRECADELALDYAKHAAQGKAMYLTKKIAALEKALERNNYPALTPAETPKIDGESEDAIRKFIPKVDDAKSTTGKTVLAVILTIALIIASFVTNDKNLHSPKQMEVDLVGKSVYFDPDKYMYGCYYIDLEFEVEANWTGVDYTEFKVYISEKGGEELGFVRASMSDMGIEAGEKKVITITLSENQPEKNAFFTQLYEADLDNLKFKYEIGSIRFIDGKYYHNDDYNQFG